ncbi:unnamed protein product [Cuscuta epithymum]|uniref:Pectinesterase n=1 Tax=Cuscuta epithymum TaxID=186058 RepID=A0AAV0FU75_9ASTE|nr:unnamed protein product [Cuscuta epithymum]
MASFNKGSFTVWWTTWLILTTTATPAREAAAGVSPWRLCRRAADQSACKTIITSQLAAAAESSKTASTPSDLLRRFLAVYAGQMTAATSRFSMVGGEVEHPRERRAFADCAELMNLSVDQVNDAIRALEASRRSRTADAHTYLSAVLTNHVTCTDGLTLSPAKSPIGKVLEDLISKARVALAVVAEIRDGGNDELEEWRFPGWVKSRDRRLLRRKGKKIKADIVVSKDGDGDYTTLKQAVEAAEEGSEKRVVIYVKEGVYNEYVEVGPEKTNLMIVGDGMNETIFTGNHNYVDNYTTFNSFTLASKGANFILQDVGVRNTAGAKKHQAVALRVGGDKSIINRCLIQGFQDTLYAHSLRHFYRDCTVIGTVDFIFGNAAAVFQNCTLVSRKPMESQQNMVTAQGRVDPNQNTGTSLHVCKIVPSKDLASVTDDFPTYLGRPWKNYSRTMVMESFIDDHVDPAGWSPWSGDSYLDTLWYGEFANLGPGSGTAKRVDWPGYHVVKKASVAARFTVANLLETEDDPWVAESGVDYIEGLLNNCSSSWPAGLHEPKSN